MPRGGGKAPIAAGERWRWIGDRVAVVYIEVWHRARVWRDLLSG